MNGWVLDCYADLAPNLKGAILHREVAYGVVAVVHCRAV